VFNDMAADLKSLYEELEEKVAERTKRLQQANYQIQRRALHLQASQDVGQAITSVRDPALLLNQVTDLIRECFVYASVAIYIVEPGGGEIRLRALSPAMRSDTVMDAGVSACMPVMARSSSAPSVNANRKSISTRRTRPWSGTAAR
jgi:hypothetical protein